MSLVLLIFHTERLLAILLVAVDPVIFEEVQVRNIAHSNICTLLWKQVRSCSLLYFQNWLIK